jgi:protein-S-isoprenylcysteine O-methyltransferase Ste14
MKSPFNIPPVYLFSGIITILLSFFLFPQYNLIHFPYNLTGLVIIIVSFYASGKAYDLFSKHKTTLTFNEPSVLVMEGIYKYTRNPMYLGMLLLITGISVSLGNMIGLVVPIIFFFIINFIFIPFEEKKMSKSFGNDYKEYCGRVRRWL